MARQYQIHNQGGFRDDFVSSWYQMSSPVFDEDSPPNKRARKVKAKTLSFLSNKLSISKKSSDGIGNITK